MHHRGLVCGWVGGGGVAGEWIGALPRTSLGRLAPLVLLLRPLLTLPLYPSRTTAPQVALEVDDRAKARLVLKVTADFVRLQVRWRCHLWNGGGH